MHMFPAYQDTAATRLFHVITLNQQPSCPRWIVLLQSLCRKPREARVPHPEEACSPTLPVSPLSQIIGTSIPPQATSYCTNTILQWLLLSPPLRYLRKMSTAFSLVLLLLLLLVFSLLSFVLFFSLKNT